MSVKAVEPIQTSTMPLLSISSKETIRNCSSLQDCDIPTVFIVSYPKSGTTWTQAIVFNLITYGQPLHEHISKYSPFFEIDATWGENIYAIETTHRSLNWRIYNTHLRFDMMPKGVTMKYIYVIRNGKDVVNSFWHHLSNQVY